MNPGPTEVPARFPCFRGAVARDLVAAQDPRKHATHAGSTRSQRGGYTLLEMILAMAIGLVILGALYVTMNLHLTSAQAGRELVQDGTLARAVLTRVANDVVNNLGPVDPKVLPEEPSQEPETPSSESSSSSSASSSSSDTKAPTATVDVTAPTFNMGVLGQPGRLVLYVSRVPRELNLQGKGQQRLASDLRRITYWVAEGGLAREEVILVTGQEINSLAPDVANPKIIAPEVKKIEFQYFDGYDWWDDWDGSIQDPNLELPNPAPRGPPSAIAVTITIQRKSNLDDGPPLERTYRQVIVIPAGNNFPSGESP